MNGWNHQSLGEAYWALENALAEVGQPDDSPVTEAIRRALDAIEEADILMEGSDA